MTARLRHINIVNMAAEMETGRRLSVVVESIFDGGIVVSFTGRDGSDYRGALLTSGTVRDTCRRYCSATPLANPLTYLHDHPYSKLKNYAKRLANSIPTEVLLDWNSTPVELLGQTKQSFSRCNGVIADTVVPRQQERSATVEVALCDDPVTFSDMDIIDYLPIRNSSTGRLAKSRALVNIKASFEDPLKTVDATFTRGRGGSKRRAVPSASPEPPRKRQCNAEKTFIVGLNSSVHHPVSHSGTEPNGFHVTDSGELQDPLNCNHSPLRNFSLKLHRVPASSPRVLPHNSSRGGAVGQ